MEKRWGEQTETLYSHSDGDLFIRHPGIIVEPSLNGGTIAEVCPIEPLHCLPQDVGTGVPEHLLA